MVGMKITTHIKEPDIFYLITRYLYLSRGDHCNIPNFRRAIDYKVMNMTLIISKFCMYWLPIA